MAALSLAINYPTAASAPHSIVNGFKRLLSIAVETDIDFAEAEQVGGLLLSHSLVVPSQIDLLLSRR